MKFKLVYEKDGMIKGSQSNIPTEADTDIVTREALEECKLVYFADGKFMGSKTDAIPSADDEVLYTVEEPAEGNVPEGEDEEEITETPDEPGNEEEITPDEGNGEDDGN